MNGEPGTPAVEATGLCRFPPGRGPDVLHDVSFELPQGARLALIGGNGAGKSTLIRLLVGIAPIGAGSASLFGRPVPSPASRCGLGFVPENAAPFPHLTGREYLHLFAALEGIPDHEVNERLTGLVDSVGLGHVIDNPTRRYSKGQRQRLDIARLFLLPRSLLILDEPFSGLDGPTRLFLEDQLEELAGDGTTMIITSHHASFLERFCTHVALLHRGRLERFGTRDEILVPSAWHIRLRQGTKLPSPLPPGASLDRSTNELVFADRATAEEALRGLTVPSSPEPDRIDIESFGPVSGGIDTLLREVMGS